MSTTPRFRRSPIDMEPVTTDRIEALVAPYRERFKVEMFAADAQVARLDHGADEKGEVRPTILLGGKGDGQLVIGTHRTGLELVMRNPAGDPALYEEYLRLHTQLDAWSTPAMRLLGTINRYRGLLLIAPLLVKGGFELSGMTLPDTIFLPLLAAGFTAWIGLWVGLRSMFKVVTTRAFEQR